MFLSQRLRMYEYLQTGVDTCMYMCIKYRAQQAMILQTTLYFSWALGAGVTEALHPQCSLVYLACLVPSASVSPLVQKLRSRRDQVPRCAPTPSPCGTRHRRLVLLSVCLRVCRCHGFTEQTLEPTLGVLAGATLKLASVCQGC